MIKKYTQATRTIQKWIVDAGLVPGTKVPSGRKLAKQFGFSRPRRCEPARR
jgi:DNA-binding GntR family transcriptional regulator